ncbi:MAG: hypothetical protein J5746_04835 [Victivallales bacterium]|nr:hypothetical protein [Victivallales bacterium]
MFRRTFIFATLVLLCNICIAAEGGIVNIPAIGKPKLDGVIDKAEWDKAARGEFFHSGTGNAPQHATTWRMGCDKDNLYIAFHCNEPDIAHIKRNFAHTEERDNAIHQDDCVEVFIEPFGNNKDGLFHFAVNTNGIIYDAFNGDTTFESGIHSACKLNKDNWELELLIPFADLGLVPGGAEILRINLGRERNGHTPPEYSCLGKGSGGFLDRSRLRQFRPMPHGNKLPPVTFLALGSPLAPEMRFANTETKDNHKYTVTLETYDSSFSKLGNFSLKTTPGRESRLDYKANGQKKVASIKYSVLSENDAGKVLYSGTFTFPQLSAKEKLLALPVDKPLFNELLSNEHLPKRDFHGFQWIFGVGQKGYMQQFGIQYGIPFSVRGVAQENKDTGMANYSNLTMIDWMNKEVFCKELGIPIAAMPRVLERNIKSGLHHASIVIPEIRKLWLEDVKTIASNKQVRIITWADESAECAENRIIADFKQLPDNADLKEFDAMVKQKYGKGKYGIPASFDESDPLAWIAYRRALNDELVKLYHEAYDLAKSINPDIIVVSDDPVGHQSKIYSFADWKDSFDIVTHQLYPRNHPGLDDFGFVTRYVSTLTGAEEFWPCPHIEEYGASFTPMEVLYKLSAAVRNGATGFHYYLHDSTGNNSGKKYLIHERWGAPDRYAVEIGAQKMLATMPKLAFPEWDSAVFTSTDSLRALPFRATPANDIYLHTYLGYGAGLSYSFVNEQTLEKLANYKLIITVENKYISKKAMKALQSYVREGGTLLVLWNDAFQLTPEGDSLEKERQALTGVEYKGYCVNPLNFNYGGKRVPVAAIRCPKLNPLRGAKTLVRFANGDAALVENRCGKGKVLTLAANPCSSKLIDLPEWKSFFLKICQQCDVKTKCDFWRFQFPASILPKNEALPEKCLTNNYVKWEHFTPVMPCNGNVTGTYTFSPEPNWAKDVQTGIIPFDKGKLTDRPRAAIAPSACKNKSHWMDWSIGYNGEKKPVSIDCKWSAKRNVKRVRLFISGIWRNASLEIGGVKYDFPCAEDFNKDSFSVRVAEFALPKAVSADALRITLEANPQPVIITEMEIWSD